MSHQYNLLRREIEARFQSLWSYVLDQTEMITMLGVRVTATDDLAARLNTATNELAADLQALRDEVAGLDAGVAAKFEPLVSRLEAMGVDPANPVPDPEPVTDGGGLPGGGSTDEVNPTPGSE